MRTCIFCAASLMGLMGLVAEVAVAAENNSSLAPLIPPQSDFILKECQQTPSTGDPRSAGRAVDPAYMLTNYYASFDYKIDLQSIKTTLLQGTAVGKITSVIDNTGRSWYRYDPPAGYEGKDQAIFLAEFEGKRFKIILNLVVSPTVGESPLLDGEEPVCPLPTLIKVTKPAKPSSGSSGYDLNSVSITFADLQGAVLGQTNTNGMKSKGPCSNNFQRVIYSGTAGNAATLSLR